MQCVAVCCSVFLCSVGSVTHSYLEKVAHGYVGFRTHFNGTLITHSCVIDSYMLSSELICMSKMWLLDVGLRTLPNVTFMTYSYVKHNIFIHVEFVTLL